MTYSNFVNSIQQDETFKEKIDEISKDKEIYQEDQGYKKSFMKTLIIIWSIVLFFSTLLFVLMYFRAHHYCYIPYVIGFLVGSLLTLERIFNHKSFLSQSIGPRIVSTIYEDATYDPSGAIDENYLKTLNDFNVNNLTQEHFIKGKFENHNCQSCDITSTHIEKATGKDGKVYSENSIDFDGSVYLIELNKEYKDKIAIFHSSNANSLHSIEIGSKEFNLEYNVYSSSKETVKELLTDNRQKKLVDMAKSIKGPFRIYVVGKYVTIVVSKLKTDFSVISTNSLKENVQLVVYDCAYLAYFVDCLME